MAALFELDADQTVRGGECDNGVWADSAFAQMQKHLGELRSADRLRYISRYQSQLSAMKTAELAAVTAERGERAAKRALRDGKTSKASIARAARRAEAAVKNAALVDKMAAGELSEDQLDVIADTSARTDGAAAIDTAFIDQVAGTDPDQAKAIADEFVADHATKDGVKSEHERQRVLRRAAKYFSKKKGLDVIALEGDGIAAKMMWDKIEARANELYLADGGRDLATSKHPRTREQRLFDAAVELICDVTTTPTGIKHRPRHSTKTGRRSGPPSIVVTMTLDQYLGLDPAAMAEQIGLGLIPDTVLADYLEHADIIGALYDRNGSPLWIARTKRHATVMQRYALILRDKACVLCGADHQQCQAHHTMPWTAPSQGTTDLDNLVLLCAPCHRELHNNNQTVYVDHHRRWRNSTRRTKRDPRSPSSAATASTLTAEPSSARVSDSLLPLHRYLTLRLPGFTPAQQLMPILTAPPAPSPGAHHRAHLYAASCPVEDFSMGHFALDLRPIELTRLHRHEMRRKCRPTGSRLPSTLTPPRQQAKPRTRRHRTGIRTLSKPSASRSPSTLMSQRQRAKPRTRRHGTGIRTLSKPSASRSPSTLMSQRQRAKPRTRRHGTGIRTLSKPSASRSPSTLTPPRQQAKPRTQRYGTGNPNAQQTERQQIALNTHTTKTAS